MKRYLENEIGGFPQHFATSEATAYDSMVEVFRELIAEPSTASVKRVLEDEEIEAMRSEYTQLYENDRVDCEHELAELEVEKRKIEERIKAKRDEMASIMQHINDNVRTINDGYITENLNEEESFKAVVDGYVLHYTYIGDEETKGCFTLAKVEEVSKSDRSIFALQTNNQEKFIKRFGADFNALNNFMKVEATEDNKSLLIGFKLAVAVHTEFADIERDTIIDAQMANWLVKDEAVESVVVYAKAHLEERA